MKLTKGMRVRIHKDVTIIGGRLGTVCIARHHVEHRFVAVKLMRALKGYHDYRGEAWLVDRSMLKEAK